MTFPNSPEVESYSKEELEELEGQLAKQDEEDKLMNSVLENDKETIDDGLLINESLNKSAILMISTIFILEY